MAIAYDTTSTGSGVNASWSHTATGSNVVLFVAAYGIAGDDVSGVTFDGAAMTLIDKEQTDVTNNEWAYLYYKAVGTGAGSAKTVAITGGDGGFAMSYTGCKQTGIPDSSAKLGGVSDDPLVVSTTVVLNNSWLVGSYAGNRGTLAGTGTTLRGGAGQFTSCDSNGAVLAGSRSLSVDQDGSAAVNAMVIASFAPSTTDYPLTAALGTFTFTGVAATFIKQLNIAVDTIAYTLTGIAATLPYGRTLIANLGTFILSGIDAVFSFTNWTKANKSSTSFSGQSKNSASFSNSSKASTTWDNEQK